MNTDQAAETALLETLYACFAKRDFKGMAECYHPTAEFRDPFFNLKGKSIAAMWHMLCTAGGDLRLETSGIKVENGKGRARWVAFYTLASSGRKIRNAVRSEFRFKDGKISWERDEFSFWRWSIQALGATGFFLGWMPRLLQTVQRNFNGNLKKFILAHPEYSEG